MRKFFKKLLTTLLVISILFYIIDSGLLVTTILPYLENFFQVEEPNDAVSVSEDSSSMEHFIINNPISQPDSVDEGLIRDTILQLTNRLRTEQNVGTVQQNDTLQSAADIRAQESAESFSHTRPNGTEFHTVLNEGGLEYFYSITGENLAMATYHLDDPGMAEFLFEGWVESPGHYENMIEAGFEELGVGVYYDGEILYLVQIFGSSY
ncbi:CAP domain-containing protein [Jeotgalibaca ciconiae]|uniref:CAP domain-containing protein n=1 Tax=Jeotgalibaca ciconiae TaxID=2496265 RepID=A0A3S9HBB7_9LACT|nr:CAP domain-containing protein [Jeotgalibaca ciconiae]AZP04658.1 CAP domain-containing protein [Jeotgalibaca ciconiae]